MALTSVNPNQFTPTPPDESDPTVGNGVKIPQTPVPGASSADNQAMATMKGSDQIAQATQAAAKAAKKSDSGGIFGTIGSIVGKALPFFLSCGGMVNYAEGGPFTPDAQSMNDPSMQGEPSQEQPAPDQIGMAVTVGVILEKYFGGDFDKLPDAAHMFQQMIAQGQDPSQVGEDQPPSSGMPQMGSMPMPQAQEGSPQGMPEKPQGMAMGGAPQPQQPMPQPNVPTQPMGFMQPQNKPLVQGQPMNRPQQGFMQPMMASGGAPPQGQPLAPGQQFAGDGEVKGPGGPESDSIPARLSNGEYVMSAPAVAFHGVKAMDKINEEGKQGFFQSQAQVQANQGAPGPPMLGDQPQAAPPAAPGMPMGNMPPPMQQAKGGSAVQRTKGSGFMV